MPSKLEARVTQHDREIAAIRKLVLQGMKMLVENGAQIKALAVAQRATEKRLDALSITVEPVSASTVCVAPLDSM